MAIGIGAYGASELLFHTKKNESSNKSMEEVLKEAKERNAQILKLIPQIEDGELKKWIKEISDSIIKIIETVKNKPDTYKKMGNFFDYYLPVTIKILKRYDEIENQRLTNEESKKFMNSTKDMVRKINDAFKSQLANLYQSDIMDTDAEMKVFETMLKSDGFYEEKDFLK